MARIERRTRGATFSGCPTARPTIARRRTQSTSALSPGRKRIPHPGLQQHLSTPNQPLIARPPRTPRHGSPPAGYWSSPAIRPAVNLFGAVPSPPQPAIQFPSPPLFQQLMRPRSPFTPPNQMLVNQPPAAPRHASPQNLHWSPPGIQPRNLFGAHGSPGIPNIPIGARLLRSPPALQGQRSPFTPPNQPIPHRQPLTPRHGSPRQWRPAGLQPQNLFGAAASPGIPNVPLRASPPPLQGQRSPFTPPNQPIIYRPPGAPRHGSPAGANWRPPPGIRPQNLFGGPVSPGIPNVPLQWSPPAQQQPGSPCTPNQPMIARPPRTPRHGSPPAGYWGSPALRPAVNLFGSQ